VGLCAKVRALWHGLHGGRSHDGAKGLLRFPTADHRGVLRWITARQTNRESWPRRSLAS
jgi:hypothetical protein